MTNQSDLCECGYPKGDGHIHDMPDKEDNLFLKEQEIQLWGVSNIPAGFREDD